MIESIFDPRTMQEALIERRAPRTFLIDMFFQDIKEFDTEKVDIDIQRNKRVVASYVRRREQGQFVETQGYSTNSYAPPYLKPKMESNASKRRKRQIGNVIYANGKSNMDTVAEAMGKDLAFLDDMIVRTEELQAAQALFDGVVAIKDLDGEKVIEDIDFGRSASHDVTLTGGERWTQGASDPIKTIDTQNTVNVKSSGVQSDVCVMGTEAANAFISNEKVIRLLDVRNFEIGQLQLQAQSFGVKFLGYIDGVKYYRYDEWYFDEITQTEKPLLDPKKVLLGSSQAITSRSYGAIEHEEAGINAMMRFPWTYRIEDPSATIVQLHSAPLVIPHQIDAFSVIKVVS